MPGRPRKVEKLWKNSAKPTASPASDSAMSTSAYGREPNRCVCSTARSSTTSWARCSYAASAPISSTIVSRSLGTAGRITWAPYPARPAGPVPYRGRVDLTLRLLETRVGRPQPLGDRDTPSTIAKSPVGPGPLTLDEINLAGDDQA